MPGTLSYGPIMVTSKHEASHRIFQDRPELMGSVFDMLGMRLPEKAVVEVLSPDATEIRPVERRVDSVLRISLGDGSKDTFLLAIEAQLRQDSDKAVSWAYYLSYLKAKYDCPAMLLVVCQDKATADWAAGPFHLGPKGWYALTVRPLVVSPKNVPVITDAVIAAKDMALAAFSAMTHGKHEDIRAILVALATALTEVDEETLGYYSEILEVGLGNDRARNIWRELMVSPIFFPGRGTLREELLLEGQAMGLEQGREQGLERGLEQGLEQGRAEGLAEGLRQGAEEATREGRHHYIIDVLQNRGLKVPGEICTRVITCTDLGLLERWAKRAWKVDMAEDLFAEEG
jgi:hypothetical protein